MEKNINDPELNNISDKIDRNDEDITALKTQLRNLKITKDTAKREYDSAESELRKIDLTASLQSDESNARSSKGIV